MVVVYVAMAVVMAYTVMAYRRGSFGVPGHSLYGIYGAFLQDAKGMYGAMRHVLGGVWGNV